MMEKFTHVRERTKPRFPQASPSNDNRRTPLSIGRLVFPGDAVARIYKPSRAVTSSGRARTKCWRLVFERRTAPVIEPLMGYTGGNDTLAQVELSFPTLESAIRYAEQQGLTYVVQQPSRQCSSRPDRETPARNCGSTQAFSDATLDRLGLSVLQDSYERALDGAATRDDPSGPESWTSPMGVVRDQATNEGMPENSRPARLDEVEQALLALEGVAADRNDSGVDEAA